ERPYKCSKCRKGSDLIRHLQIHTGERASTQVQRVWQGLHPPFQQPCVHSQEEPGALLKTEHQHAHRAGKPYKHLRAARALPGALISSATVGRCTHIGEHLYKSPACGKSFSLSSALFKH
ncbi:ZNF7 protein, partial [Eudromia elegans]|nr:ZNF7 protein [Eudromia elegans]